MSAQTLPDLKGFATYYGLQLSDVGEDAAVVILGHHPDDPLRVIAALNCHARTFWGLTNLIDQTGAPLSDVTPYLCETHAVLLTSCDDPDHEPDCGRCREITAGDWWIEWDHAGDEPGAFPVTVWSP